jgi:hypothetical protein
MSGHRTQRSNALLGAAQIEEKTGQGERALPHLRALIAARPEYDPAYESLLRVAAKEVTYRRLPVSEAATRQESRPTRRYTAILKAYERAANRGGTQHCERFG